MGLMKLSDINRMVEQRSGQGTPHNTGIQCRDRKHTPIVSKKQFGKFGAELARRRKGKKRRMKGITTEELRSHLKETKGKKLPKRAKT